MRRHSSSELIFWGNWGVQLAGKWGELFIWFQTSPLCGDEKLCEGMKWLKVTEGRGGGALPVGLALINWGLVRFVGLSVLKWASVSSSPSPGALRGYLVVIPPRFLGFSLTLPFISKEITWKGSVCCLLLWQKWHCGRWCDGGVPETTSSHAPYWFNVPQLHTKVCQLNRA